MRAAIQWVCTLSLLLAEGVSAANGAYVGRAVCAGCHEVQTALWSGSHHDLAMQVAAPDTVLGDFNNSRFEHYGIVSTFNRKGDEFWVKTEGPDGKLQNYRIQYTFGIEPLQQYLIEFPGGRLQALSIAWDARLKAGGGQRWFHLLLIGVLA